VYEYILHTWGQFNTNYFIFRNFEISKRKKRKRSEFYFYFFEGPKVLQYSSSCTEVGFIFLFFLKIKRKKILKFIYWFFVFFFFFFNFNFNFLLPLFSVFWCSNNGSHKKYLAVIGVMYQGMGLVHQRHNEAHKLSLVKNPISSEKLCQKVEKKISQFFCNFFFVERHAICNRTYTFLFNLGDQNYVKNRPLKNHCSCPFLCFSCIFVCQKGSP